jgi:hypothetical protein
MWMDFQEGIISPLDKGTLTTYPSIPGDISDDTWIA